jgi:RNA polymerase sigma-70 factor (ECF subfamily)
MRWNEIVDEHGPLVWRVAYRLLGNDADAADCYQDAFAAALAISRREVVRNWGALLRRVATTHALDRLRRRLTRAGEQAIALADDAPAASVAPAQAAEQREFIDCVRAALAELPDAQAHAFSLACIDELSYEQAAAEMNVTPAYFGVLLHRARGRLRELLATHVEFDVKKGGARSS